MLDWNTLLWHGALLALLFASVVLLVARRAPRMFLVRGEVPPDIFAAAAPLNAAEQAQSTRVMGVLMAILVGGTLYSTYTFAQHSGVGYGVLFLHALLIQLSITTFDLIFIDWLVLNTLTPAWSVFAGTEGLPGYKEYSFHAKVHLKLLPRQLLGAAAIAGIALLLARLV
ncbi:MAG: hypothetical protein KF821_09835 [Anaerolineales bacterium]|jgi:hypothetical protein|nr:hypothetical protein [Anaerolineales bacterium]